MDTTQLMAKQLWHAALERVREKVTGASFDTWFKATEGWECGSGEIVVVAPNAFACGHLQQRFLDTARSCVAEALGRTLEVRFIVRPPARPHEQRDAAVSVSPAQGVDLGPHSVPAGEGWPLQPDRTATAPDRDARVGASHGGRRERTAPSTSAHTNIVGRGSLLSQPRLITTVSPAETRRTSIRPTASSGATPMTSGSSALSGLAHLPTGPGTDTSFSADPAGRHVFETFVVGTTNLLAHAGATEVARAPGQSYNPLFIYGGTGLGKTHLLLAIGHVATRKGLRVCYVTAERFANDIIEAIRHHTTEAFRAHYRAVDVLLVDDIQFIAGKESTEEEFFHTFNALHESNRQIVLSSDRVPRAMRHLHDRLRSRFVWGLLADIRPPDLEHRVAILRAKAANLGASISDRLLEAVAQPECASVRELEGALNRVMAYASMMGSAIDENVIASALGPLRGGQKRDVTCERVLSLTAQHFGVTPAALQGTARAHLVAWPRQVAMYLLREATSMSLSQVGECLGGRDHTTVMHGCAHVAAETKAKPHIRQEVDELLAQLRS